MYSTTHRPTNRQASKQASEQMIKKSKKSKKSKKEQKEGIKESWERKNEVRRVEIKNIRPAGVAAQKGRKKEKGGSK